MILDLDIGLVLLTLFGMSFPGLLWRTAAKEVSTIRHSSGHSNAVVIQKSGADNQPLATMNCGWRRRICDRGWGRSGMLSPFLTFLCRFKRRAVYI
ncbi:hypothetical protein F5Y07DRAFT_128314 [Xylaria sp. FL0933]|nr:hypothetical protein F5Y07DRAFT_128314 [Xylaria sp. FL0933]